jgi:MFS family permease
MWNPIINLRGTPLQALITFACASGFFLFGYDQGVFSGVIVTPYFLDTFHNPGANLLGTINAIYDVGAAVGALTCLLFGHVLGRKKVVLTGCVVASVGAVLQGTAKHVAQLIVGRKLFFPSRDPFPDFVLSDFDTPGIIGGIGVGQLTSTIGIYQAETSKGMHCQTFVCFSN